MQAEQDLRILLEHNLVVVVVVAQAMLGKMLLAHQQQEEVATALHLIFLALLLGMQPVEVVVLILVVAQELEVLVGQALAAMVVKTALMQLTELQILDQAVAETVLTLVETYKAHQALAAVV
jgi:hypothetical protein